MSVLGRIRLFPPAPESAAAPRPPVAVVAAGSELGDDDLEAVVGGLERVYVPDPAGY
jgi:hypothetical protein